MGFKPSLNTTAEVSSKFQDASMAQMPKENRCEEEGFRKADLRTNRKNGRFP